MKILSWIQSEDWNITVGVLGETFWWKNISKKGKNEKETVIHLSLAYTAFYCCSCGEDEGGVSIFSPGPEIWIMVRSVGKNLMRKYQIIKSKLKMVNIYSFPCTHCPCSLLSLWHEPRIPKGYTGTNNPPGPHLQARGIKHKSNSFYKRKNPTKHLVGPFGKINESCRTIGKIKCTAF